MKKSIRMLELPLKMVKVFENNNIYTVDKILELDFTKFNFLTSEINELNNIIDKYLYSGLVREVSGNKKTFDYKYLDSKYSLTEFNLSFRTYNALINNGIELVSELLAAVESFEIYKFEGFGSKSAVQSVQIVREIFKNENIDSLLFNEKNVTDDLSIDVSELSPLIKQSLSHFNIHTLGDIRKMYLSGELFELFNRKTLGSIIDEYMKFIYDTDINEFKYLENFLLHKWFGKISFEDLRAYITGIEIDINDFVDRLYVSENIVVVDNVIRLKTFKEKIIDAKLKEETKDIIFQRFSGNTLQVVADNFGKTRERIRQIVRDRSDQIEVFFEKAFIQEIEKYNWYKEVFKIVYNLDEFSYNVVKFYSEKTLVDYNYETPMDYIVKLNNNKYFEKTNMQLLEKELEKLSSPKIEIYGETYDLMTKREFLEFVIEHYLPSYGLHKTKIVKLANKVSKDNGLDYSYDKYIDIVSNTVQGFQNIRYYNYNKITEQDINDLKKIIYEVDSVYSMKHFYKKYPVLMNRLGLKDGYELHFILRRLFAESEEFSEIVDFNRQPILARKDLTIFDVINKHWRSLKEPANVDDFAQSLSKRYGYHIGTLVNNINSYLGDYISVKNLYLEKPILSEELLNRIKVIMTDEFYEITELEEIFKNNNIYQKDYGFFTNFWLDSLGYKTHDINYIIKKEYNSLKEVFFTKVLKEDIYHITEKDHKMRETTLILFLETLREEYLAFPTKDEKLYTMKYLEKQGVKEEVLREYVNELSKIIEEERYFTYYNLKKNNYEKLNPVFQLVESYNIDEDIMNDLLRNIPGVKKSTKGDLFCITNNLTVVKNFVKQIAKDYNIDNQNDINKIMKEEYGISFKKSDFLDD